MIIALFCKKIEVGGGKGKTNKQETNNIDYMGILIQLLCHPCRKSCDCFCRCFFLG